MTQGMEHNYHSSLALHINSCKAEC